MARILMARGTHRAFNDRPVSSETLEEIIRMASCAPSGHNNQLANRLVINDVVFIGYPNNLYPRMPLRNEPRIKWREDLK
jgi:nitroreductase